jgi:hypothetical protein
VNAWSDIQKSKKGVRHIRAADGKAGADYIKSYVMSLGYFGGVTVRNVAIWSPDCDPCTFDAM